MANQPTKYSKFLVGAASAALVASAVAPVASAADFSDIAGNTHAEAIKALSETGVVSGYPDGTFKPNQELTRGNVVKFLGKWLVAQGYEIPADAVSNPRFVDLKTTSEKETLEYAAVVKDNGVFVGSNGNLMASNKMTRQDMAVVIVRALNTVNNIDLETYVAGQTFDRDVKDLNSAYASKKSAIDVFDFFDITNPSVAAFNPNNTTTRGQFVSFLNRSIDTDFSDVTGAVTGAAAVKAINATTVEVSFKEAVTDINSLKFTIEGLAISNAAVKQTGDNKVVVLTTAIQEGGKEYTVSQASKAIGSFKGLSAVVPAKIDITTQSVQGKVGAQAVLSADVGVKQAGIPVTFNVKADTTNTLNKDQVFEAVTNAEGIATFSYTQYAAGDDQVVAYPTGAPAVRSLGYVFWGVDTILSVKAQDDKGNSVNNGADKTYKVTYLDPKTGKPVANQKFNVTFAENVNVNIDKTSKATVNGVNPTQLLNNADPVVATITTDAKGEAVFTVSGHNTAVTPVVFEVTGKEVTKYEADKLQAKVDKLTFGALQADYVIDVTRAEGGEEAAIGLKNGREYKVVVKTKDGKVAANELVNVAFNEDIDRAINTNTQAYFVNADGDAVANPRTQSYTVKTDAKGEAKFTIASGLEKDYATPVVWIDINSADAREGKLDEGEPNKVAPITYFDVEKLTGGVLTPAKSVLGKKTEKFTGVETAYFTFTASNQSGKAFTLDSSKYKSIDATFTVTNTGGNDITVITADGKKQVISPNRPHTVHVNNDANPYIAVVTGNESKVNLTTSVSVTANGTAQPHDEKTVRPITLGSHTAKAEFTSTSAIGSIHTGIVTKIDTVEKEITFEGKSPVSYKDASFKNVNAVTLKEDEFEKLISENIGAQVTYKKDGDKVSFEIVALNPNLSSTVAAINDTVNVTAIITALEKSGFVPAFTDLTPGQKTNVANYINTQRSVANGGVYSEARLKATYAAGYKVEVDAALLAVTTNTNPALVAASLGEVPGLDLTAYKLVTDPTDLAAVNAVIAAGSYTSVAGLQTAIANAITGAVNAPVVSALQAVNTAASADTVEIALNTHATTLGLTSYAGLTATEKTGVATYLFANKAGGNFNLAGLQAAYANAVTASKTAPVLEGVKLDTAAGTLTLTFSQEVTATGFDLSLPAGTVADIQTAAPTAVGKTIVIKVSSNVGLAAGQVVTSVTVTNLAGKAAVPAVNVPIK